MFSFLFGGFGLSTLWLIRPFWRLLRPLFRRQPPTLGGQGAIRFWLGVVLVLLASTTLEGVIIEGLTAGAPVGGALCHALSGALSGLMGPGITAWIALAILAVALPWYAGMAWPAMLAHATRWIEPLGEGAVALAQRLFRRGAGNVSHRRSGAVRRTPRPARARMDAARARPVATETPDPSVGAPARTTTPPQPVIDQPWRLPKSTRTAASEAIAPQREPRIRPPAVSTGAIVAAAQASAQRAEVSPQIDTRSAVGEVIPEPQPVYVVEPSLPPVVEAPFSPAPPQTLATVQATHTRSRGYAANDEAEAPPSLPRAMAVAATPVPLPTSRVPVAAHLPGLDLLAARRYEHAAIDEAQLAETGELIEQRLREFKVPVTVVGASAGPVITRFEVEPAVGVRGNQIVALMKDLARGLGRTSIRVVETIPGKTCMGLELPNEQRQMIALSEIFDSNAYRQSDSLLTLAMGKGITGEPVVADLAKAPHMLVAGTTGSGKSVAVNAMILSMLYKATPDDVRMIMIDPKMLELSVYEGIPHLLAPVVTDMKLAANALNWCVAEMENRYKVMSDLRVRNLAGFNQKVREARAAGRPLMNPFPAHPEIPELLDTLPMIVVVIDELADLMMVAGKKIEELIARLAQKARAAGIHLILATQRPSVDVITGLIKANIPTRVAFQVSSKIDSRTILDQMGAESLLGQGDMLFMPPGTGYPQRIHGAFVADEEVHRVVAWLKQFGEPNYKDEILAGPPSEGSGELFTEEGGDAELDPLYDEAAAFVLRTRRASISFVQRQFRIGYNRAARLVEAMEAAGLVSSMGINGQRDVIAPAPME